MKAPEDIAYYVSRLDRSELLSEISNFQGRFPLDFTSDFLGRQSDEKLRHILFVVNCQQAREPGRAAASD